ncbi:30S ribosomal protein S6 [Candidatus Dojkabacteria bacterium]|nr:30S ribosomal protein S6 [Candidatus Dojkabacteria bacterium]
MKYELMVIIKPLLPEDIKSKVLTRIEKLIKKSNGKVAKTDIWGKRHLAYPIKKHEEGYYVVLDIEMPAENTKEFEADLKLQNDVLRHLLLREDNK